MIMDMMSDEEFITTDSDPLRLETSSSEAELYLSDSDVELRPKILSPKSEFQTRSVPHSLDFQADQALNISADLPEQSLSSCSIIETIESHLKCDICKKTFKSKPNLYVHKQTHSYEKPFKCDQCDQSFTTLPKLNKHKKIHSKEAYSCDLCERTFITETYLIRHMAKHPKFGGYNCNPCDQKFQKRDCLSSPFDCDQCDSSFISSQSLLSHTRYAHSDARPFLCNTCDARFKTQNYLYKHTKIHTTIRSFFCDKCDRSFKMKRNLTLHQRVHSTVKKAQCDECQKWYKNKGDLLQHKLFHSKDSSFTCNYCAKPFKNQKLLYQHIRYHKIDGPVSCNLCHATFELTCQLSGHKKLDHSSPVGEQTRVAITEKPLPIPRLCDLCGVLFNFLSDFNLHLLVHQPCFVYLPRLSKAVIQSFLQGKGNCIQSGNVLQDVKPLVPEFCEISPTLQSLALELVKTERLDNY